MEERYDNGPFGLLAFFDDGSLYDVNSTAASVLKYAANDLRSMNIERILTLSARIFYQTHFYPLVKMQGHAEEIFLILQAKDGSQIPVLLNAKRMDEDGRSLTCCAFLTVYNRKKFEDELVNSRKAAENALRDNTDLAKAKLDLQEQASNLEVQLQRVRSQHEELQQLNHVVTHSLKEPLRKIMLYTSMLKDDIHSPTIDKLSRSSEQMKAVVAGLQEYLWLNEKENTFTPVNLDDVIDRAVQQVQSEVGDDAIVISRSMPVTIEADAEQLTLLFYHILMNAVKFKQSGPAMVSISAVVINKNKFREMESQYEYEEFVRLEIVDKGIGFDPEYSKHIFELFRKLHHRSGQGLGLALCNIIAKNHGGWMEAESKKMEYTKIIIWLPVKQAQVES